MKKIVLWVCLLLTGFYVFACGSKDINPNQLIGSWDLISIKSLPDSTWKEVAGSGRADVIFTKTGAMRSSGMMPFDGGWCNLAERYSLDGDIIHLEFGKPNCIPYINPKVPDTAKITNHTKNTLTIYWNNRYMNLIRR